MQTRYYVLVSVRVPPYGAPQVDGPRSVFRVLCSLLSSRAKERIKRQYPVAELYSCIMKAIEQRFIHVFFKTTHVLSQRLERFQRWTGSQEFGVC